MDLGTNLCLFIEISNFKSLEYLMKWQTRIPWKKDKIEICKIKIKNTEKTNLETKRKNVYPEQNLEAKIGYPEERTNLKSVYPEQTRDPNLVT